MNFETIKTNVNTYSEYYTLCISILVFYYQPRLFFSVIFIFSLYGFYKNIITDFQFDIKLVSNKKPRQKSRANFLEVPDFDKPAASMSSEIDLPQLDDKTKTE